jgi:hypothetical protein
MRRTVITLIASFTLLGATACEPVDSTGTPAASVPPGGSAPAAGPGPAAASAQLDALAVAGQKAMTGYSRDRFPHWRIVEKGCDTRDEVLKRDGTGVQSSKDCKITSGTWVSAYDGKTFTDPQQLDIDHMVPLANAWRSGADSWTDDKRSDFANDMTRPQLIAVSLTTNRSKGDQDPSTWKPPSQSFWCEYAQRWIVVKTYWKLTITDREKAALREMLGTCKS